MKKTYHKLFRIPFAILLLVLLLPTGASAYGILAKQNITINFKNVSLEQVLREIKKTSGMLLLYDVATVKAYSNVSVNLANTTVENALKTALNGTSLNYRITDNTILIYTNESKPVAQPQPNIVKLKGVVLRKKNDPLVGAVVVVKGTATGAISDDKGNFSFKVDLNKKPIIVVSFTGYVEVEIPVTAATQELTIIMEHSTMEVKDVVITGIFNKAKESYTGSVTSISAKEIKMFSGQNLLQTLKNIDPAFNIRTDNDFGSDSNMLPEVNIRGNSSLPMNLKDLEANSQAKLNTPLIIMDGFPITLQKLMDFNDDEIENITILKDASATAIYGSRGSNGVVVVTTKAPKAGKINVFVKAEMNIEMPDLSSYNLMNASEKLETERLVGYYTKNNGAQNIEAEERYNSIYKDVLSGVDTYWLSKPVQVGIGQKYNIRLEGGTEDFRWSTALGYNKTDGAMKGSDKSVFNGGINLSYSVNNLIFKNQTLIGINRSNNSPYGDLSAYAKLNPYWRTHDENGKLIKEYSENVGNRKQSNPLHNASLNTINSKGYNEFVNNFSIEWEVVENLKLSGKIGITANFSEDDNFRPSDHTDFIDYKGDNFLRKGNYKYTKGDNFNYDGNITLSYSKNFVERHQLFFGVDASMSEQDVQIATFELDGFTHPSLTYLTSALMYSNNKPTGSESLSRRVGITANANYTFDNRYFADLSFRMDGSSQFGSKDKFAPFFSVGLGWNIHNENFLKDNKVINNLRLRGSYGQTGSQNFQSYNALATYSAFTNERYLFWNGSALMGFGNENLKWQKTDEYNLGIEFGLWNNRLTASADIYSKKTSNLLSEMDLTLSSGFDSYTENVGSVENNGIEAMVSGYIIRDLSRGFVWSVTSKLSYNKNKITDLSDAIKSMTAESMLANANNKLLFEGDSQNSIYVVPSLGIDPSNGEEMFVNRYGEIDYTWNAADRRFAGVAEPKFRVSISSLVSYKNFTLNVSFGMHWGGQQYNQTLIDRVETPLNSNGGNLDKRVLTERWVKAGDVKAYRNLKMTTKTEASSRFVQDNNVFEFQSANLSYRLSNDWLMKNLRAQSLNIGVNMSDIFYISSIKRERGLRYPFARRVGMNLALTF